MLRRFLTIASIALGFGLAAPPSARAQQNEGRTQWMTFETDHFRVHYYQGLRPAAERVAAVAEAVYVRVGDAMGYHPQQVVEIVLTDHTDDANGLASAVPYNRMILYVTAPEDLSTLGDYDDWLQTLVTHEFTHVAHSDNIRGLPAIINAILGKLYPPNQVQPRWILEGIATYYESRLTTGGRLHSSIWDMYLRADALENRFATIDQVSNGPNRWPHGNIWYLYGSHFIQYIVERFGPEAIARVSQDYGSQLIPYGINRSIRRATGHTYEEMFPEFLAHTRARYERQRDALRALGVREGERITFQGEDISYPRFLRDGHTVIYQSNDGRSHPMYRTLDVRQRRPSPRDNAWVATFSGYALSPDESRMVRSEPGYHRGIYGYRDLYFSDVTRQANGAVSIGEPVQLTSGQRTLYPDWSPDGDHIAYTVNHRGTQHLFEYSLAERRARSILRLRRFEQAYTPRYSPDGRRIAFSHWQRGGFRDIRVIDRATGAISEITHDRSVEMQPVWTPDGRYIIYSSDRTGVANLYATEVVTGRTMQVTNVVNGAFMPAVSPDGRTVVYVGYTSRGFDLFRMALDPSRWLEPGPEIEQGGTHVPTPPVRGVTRPYNPLQTLRPRTWLAELGSDGFGPQIAVTTQGQDVLERHAWSARFGVGLTRGDPAFDVSYSYSGLRPTMGLHAYRFVARGVNVVGGEERPYGEERWGGDVSIRIGFPALFSFHALSLSYEVQYVAPIGGTFPFAQFVDPTELPSAPPFRGFNAGLRTGWSFSRTQRYTYDVTAHEGYECSASLHGTDRALGGSFGSFDASAAVAGYIPLPLHVGRYRHVIALRAAGGMSVSERGDRAVFTVGGYPTFNPIDFVTSLVSLASSAGVGLRGYPPQSRVGAGFYLLNLEYRFPIVQVDRGISTLPIYLNRLWGNVFFDAGDAWNGKVQASNIALGMGAEVLVDVTWGYVISTTMRFGVAQGVRGDDAMLQVYGQLSTPF